MTAPLGNLVNIRDYGAVGNGSTDDYAAIQAAIEACFGSLPAGNGSAPWNNAGILYFPAGNYAVSDTLIFPSMRGGMIIGNGSKSTKFTYIGSYPGDGYSGANYLMSTTGIASCTFQGFSLDMDDAAGAHNSICFDNAAHSFATVTICNAGGSPNARGGTVQTTTCQFIDVVTMNSNSGMLIGFGDCSGGDSQTFLHCEFWDHPHAGLKATMQNAISNVVIGCKFVRCGDTAQSGQFPSGGALVGNTGTFTTVTACEFIDSGNVDVNQLGGGVPISLLGCRSSNSRTTYGDPGVTQYPWTFESTAGVSAVGFTVSSPNAVNNNLVRGSDQVGFIFDGCDCSDTDGRVYNPAANNSFVYNRGSIFGAADALTFYAPTNIAVGEPLPGNNILEILTALDAFAGSVISGTVDEVFFVRGKGYHPIKKK